jgi:ABC-type Fe3+-siderophore transport system permease subunit
MIDFLGSTGNYEWANVLLLAIVWPLCMYILFLRVIDHRKSK